MAGVCCSVSARVPLLLHPTRIHGIRCSSSSPDKHRNKSNHKRETPQMLKVAVSGVTEFLRLLSFNKTTTLDRASDKQRDELSISGMDDIVMILQADYKNAYFVTGTELYSRNLKLLVPFFDSPSIGLKKIDKGIDSEANFVLATWKLRTYLKLPWRPLICIDGSTVYDLDDEFKIVRHAESWNISAIEAVGQIFTPSGRSND